MLRLLRMLRDCRTGWTPLLLVLLVGCFSTIPPDTNDPSQQPGDGLGTATVRGLTLHKFATGDIRSHSNWSVEVRWYEKDREVIRKVIKSNNNAVYETSTTNPRFTSVRVRPLLCSFDPNDPRNECCLANTCECPEVWGSWRTLNVALGVHHNKIDLVVNCGQ